MEGTGHLWYALAQSDTLNWVAAADSYRAELVRAARMGLDSDPMAGEPTACNLPYHAGKPAFPPLPIGSGQPGQRAVAA